MNGIPLKTTRQAHPTWAALAGIGLVVVPNVVAYFALMPRFVRCLIPRMGLEHSWFTGGILILPYVVLQACAQLAAFFPLYRAAKKRRNTGLARGVLMSTLTVFLLGLTAAATMILSRIAARFVLP